jgi:hypothetical protein
MSPTVANTELRGGLDHDWFTFRALTSPSPVRLDPGKRLAVTVVVPLQYFPLDAKAPFPVPGALERPYPDIGTFSQREVGLGDGLWRLTDAARRLQVPLSLAVDRQALHRLDDSLDLLRDPTYAVLGGGEHAVCVHASGMDDGAERAIIVNCLSELQAGCGRQIEGWRSPYCSETPRTLSLLAEAGIRYVGDFACDDRPVRLDVDGRPLWALPMNHFYSDLHFIHQCRQSVDDYVAATLAGAAWLAREPMSQGSVLSLVLHPWLSGVTHRIAAIEGMLKRLCAMPEVQVLTTDQLFARSREGTE